MIEGVGSAEEQGFKQAPQDMLRRVHGATGKKLARTALKSGGVGAAGNSSGEESRGLRWGAWCRDE